MAKRRGKKSSPLTRFIILVLVILIAVFSKIGYDAHEDNETEVAVSSSDVVKVHIIDVGQGSSSLIQCGSEGILIDCGEADYANDVINYVKDSGVSELKYVIASHPHSDHIGGMAKILNNLKVDNIVEPDIDEDNLPTTSCYLNMLKAIDKNNVNEIFAKQGECVSITNVSVKFLAPVKQIDDLNNMSVICLVQAANTKFVFPGDAENNELATISSVNVKCDVMIMAHHGSRTSLDEDFLSRSGFSTAVISCGEGNSYGHPHKEILNYLNNNNIKIYRTDKSGSIVFTCDPDKNNFEVSTEK